MIGIFDSHAHYNDPQFAHDYDEVIQYIHENGVCGAINIGYDIDTSKKAQALSKKYPFLWHSVGIHPHDADKVKNDYLDTLKELSKDQRCVAIGEIGLDYFRNLSPKDTQKRVFIEQLGLAQSLDMPVIIHTRDATQDTLEILKKYNVKGVVHCFSDSAETAKVLLKMGYHIGFTGVVTFNNARKAIEAVNVVPMDRLLLETDCPYMAPVPNRGKRCTSDMISFTATKIAEIKGLSPQETVDITCENTCKLFKINL